MDRTQIERLKNDIRNDYQTKIDALVSNRDAELAAVERLESRLRNMSMTETTEAVESKTEALSRRVVPIQGGKTTYERVRAAIENHSGEFTSKDIWAAANTDGNGGEIISNSFYPVFSKILKGMGLVVVRKQAGKQPGIYMKAQ